MPIYDLTCANSHIQRDRLLKLGERPPCPECGEPTETLWDTSAGVIADEIPGGMLIEHGLCNPDGSPARYYSKSEIAKEAARRGLTPFVRHMPGAGGDKSKNTTRWI